MEIILQIGSLAFIGMLLVMAGVEENPGPSDQFNFRYQFLLVELGTELLRKTFDEQIGMKLDQYLMTNPQYISKIQVLIKKFVITETQKALLPPICMNPVTSTFDITLLSCLLRNICGLKSSSDTVWTKPAQTDTSLEADITRLRLCRNKLGHSGTVLIPQAQLDTDWKELCQIMVSLNSKLTNGVANLQGEIAKAETMEIDENLNKLHEETLKLWDEMDKAWDHRLAEISETLQRIELNQSMLNERLVQDNKKLHEGLGSVKQTIKAFEGKLDKHLLQSPQESQEDKLNAAARGIPDSPALANTYYSQFDDDFTPSDEEADEAAETVIRRKVGHVDGSDDDDDIMFYSDEGTLTKKDDENELFNHLQHVLDKNADTEGTLTLVDDAEAGAFGPVAREAKIKNLRVECEKMLGKDGFDRAYDYLKTARYDRANEATEEDIMQGLRDFVKNPSDCFLVDQLLFLEEQHGMALS